METGVSGRLLNADESARLTLYLETVFGEMIESEEALRYAVRTGRGNIYTAANRFFSALQKFISLTEDDSALKGHHLDALAGRIETAISGIDLDKLKPSDLNRIFTPYREYKRTVREQGFVNIKGR